MRDPRIHAGLAFGGGGFNHNVGKVRQWKLGRPTIPLIHECGQQSLSYSSTASNSSYLHGTDVSIVVIQLSSEGFENNSGVSAAKCYLINLKHQTRSMRLVAC